jgi:hypothetical protein
MMPYAANDLLRLRFIGTVNGEQFQNVQHFRAKQNIVSIIDFQNALTVGFLNEFRAAMCDSARYIRVGHKVIIPDRDDEEAELAIAPVVGLRNVQSMPNQVATLFKTRADPKLSDARGRFYLPSVPMDHFNQGQWSTLAVSVLTSTMARVEQWVKEGGDNGMLEWRIFSEKGGSQTSKSVHTVSFGHYPATMRSRIPSTA